MADIFISYSKADRDKVVMLAAYLESEGWSVWWDSSLTVGDAYRDEIMKQLVAARAVIVLWTATSVKSDFVRAEAGQAKAQGKLIPVKENDVGYHDIPLPFGEMHTENLSNRELIRAAVVAQLAKPQVEPGALWLVGKTLRYQALAWAGIVGGAITLFTNLRGLLELADWSTVLVKYWHEWTSSFWQWGLGLVGLSVPREWASLLTFSTFALMTAYGSRLQVASSSYKTLSAAQFANYFLGMLLLPAFLGKVVGPIAFVVPLIAFVFMPLNRERRWTAALFVMCLITVFGVMVLSDIRTPGETMSVAIALIIGIFLLYTLPLLMLTISPIEVVTRRVVFLVLGLLTLLALNQVSVFAGHLRALLRSQ